MRVRQLLAGAAITAAMFCGGEASAGPLNFGGYVGPVQIKFQNYESFTGSTISPGAVNFGVVKVTSIVNPTTGDNVWVPGGANGFLAGVFNAITVATVTPTASGFDTTNTGGVFHFWQTSASFDPGQGTGGYAAGGCSVGALCYHGITDTGGTDVLDLKLVPGTTSSTTNTLSVSVSMTTLPTSGHAQGFADITGGADAFQFGKGGFTTTPPNGNADLHFLDDFCGNGQSGCAGPTTSNWQLFSHDPVDAVVTPEPASLALLGTALLGFGSLARRRKRRLG